MKTVCEVDSSELLKLLPALSWPPGGVPGTYAMLQSCRDRDLLSLRGSTLTWPKNFPAEAFCDQLMVHYPGKHRGEILISRVVPGQKIDDHTDNSEGGCKQRVHIPLLTNPKASFREKGRAKHMAVGKAYEFNPMELHGVVNRGKTDRIHLIFNVL